MYLLDTNICIAILKDNPTVVRHFQTHYQDCYLSTLVLSELYKGVYCSTRVEKNLATLRKFELALPKIDFDAKAAEEFGKIQGELKKMGKPTGELDALIASVARSRCRISTSIPFSWSISNVCRILHQIWHVTPLNILLAIFTRVPGWISNQEKSLQLRL